MSPNFSNAQGFASIAKQHVASGHANYAGMWAQASAHQATKAIALAQRLDAIQTCCGRRLSEHLYVNSARGMRCPVTCGDADPTRTNLHQHSTGCYTSAVQS